MEEKHEAHSVAEQSRFLRWLDNFWYHYKWQTVAFLAVAILLAVALPQCGKSDGDGVTVTFAGGYVMTGDEQKGLRNALETVAEGGVVLGQYSIFTEEEIVKNNTRIDPETGKEQLDVAKKNADKAYNQDRIRSLQSYLMTGDCGVWIVSPYVYETFIKGGINVVAERRLGDLPIYEAYKTMQFLPSDCLVILTRSILGETAKDERFAEVQAYYERLIGETPLD